MALRARKSTSDYGSIYKGHPGQWSWIAHRVSGVAIVLFLFAHVVDTALVGWGPDAYDRVTRAYANPLVHLLELGLVIAVLYHSINGIRITLIDFFPKLTRQIRLISLTSTGLFLLSTLAVTVVMLKQTWDLLQK